MFLECDNFVGRIATMFEKKNLNINSRINKKNVDKKIYCFTDAFK